MSEPDHFQQDEEEYWRAAKEFVRVVIVQLNQSLKDSGVSKGRRRQTCQSFAESLAVFFDQQWLKVEGKTKYPLICFSHSFLDLDTAIDDVSPIDLPHKAVELHAMVADEIEWFFGEQNESDTAVSIGCVGDETPDVDPNEVSEDPLIASPCPACKGSGECYCIRKGDGRSAACPRCKGAGQCKHCGGTGKWIH